MSTEVDSELLKIDKEQGTIKTIGQDGQPIEVTVDELPENLKQKILDAEQRMDDALTESAEDEKTSSKEMKYQLDPWIPQE
jgi:hypothetical protein